MRQGKEVATTPPVLYSIVVPAYKEAANIPPLTRQLFAALDGRRRQLGLAAHVPKEHPHAGFELIIVDDNSRDGSVEAVHSLAKDEGYPVRIVVRTKERGLSSAVLRGFNEARGEYLLCMDADLQHPPESVPALLQSILVVDAEGKSSVEGGAEFAIGTRYGVMPAGAVSIDKDWPLYRRVISSGARLLARLLTPLSDPMTGFFALRRSAYERATKLNSIGFKICLELYVKCRIRTHAEVPIVFGVRVHGESKLSSKVIVGYLMHLRELYAFVYPGLLPFLFGLVVVAVVGVVYFGVQLFLH